MRRHRVREGAQPSSEKEENKASQQRSNLWNGTNVMLTDLDLARRLYLIKPPPKH
ncbi:hypothetical protein [Streptomyces natalensis]|uniref:hypothetical protein n=1 Tax=Streptomyces natalensis TaxID=68242 RepID=UPI000A7D0B73|nr:hypothetical protein [Streptomyces natalensis]